MPNQWTKNPPDLEQRFWLKVDKNGPIISEALGPCWVWTGSLTSGGAYGRFVIPPKIRQAHVASWIIHTGEEPRFLICHRCDNPPCVRFDHLFEGTVLDNALDAVAKGRSTFQVHPERVFGSGNTRAKLTDEQVREMRRLYPQVSKRELVNLFGVAYQTVGAILRGTTWKHLD